MPEREHRVYPYTVRPGRTKRVPWRIDFAWPDCQLAVEIEGGVFARGRHIRGSGFVEDCAKYNFLAETGWTLLRYLPPSRKNPNAIDFEQIKRTMNNIAKRNAAR